MPNNKFMQIFNRCLLLLSIPLITLINTQLNRYRGDIHILKTFIDNAIPFNTVFILPYIWWFLYFPGVLLYFAIVEAKSYYRLLISLIMGNLVSFIFFYFYPTTVPRPDVFGEDILSKLVLWIYGADNPFNCFPSIHVVNTLICTMFLFKYNKKLWVRAFSIISCVSISISTLFVKQHYLPDIILAAIICIAMYVLFTNDYIWRIAPFKKVAAYFVPARVKDDF